VNESGHVLDRYARSVMGTYGMPQRVLVRGEGAQVWDAEGRRYVDLLAGIATNALGHAHPALVAAVGEQLATLGHVSNFFATRPQVELAERLLQVLRAPEDSRVFFCSSGAEANEAAFKIARRTGRPRVVAAVGGFHGRTMGALSLTSKAAYREPFSPLVPGVDHVPFGDADALADAVTAEVGAVFLEPVLGEGGVHPAPDGYLAAAREITARAGALLVLDEVQTGIGRTGAWFAHQLPGLGLPDGVLPDVVTVAKGLGGGIPVGAAVAMGEPAAALLGAGQHGTTFGGNPVAAAAGLAVLRTVEAEGLVQRADVLGRRFTEGVLAAGHHLVAGMRGAGLLTAVVLRRPLAAEVVRLALDGGFIVNAVAPDAVRLAPPLVLSDDQADEFIQALPSFLDAADQNEES
jgi:acetylornithine/N-succinyldiaminopimelate aminotransferase